jgi:hypothetical protein
MKSIAMSVMKWREAAGTINPTFKEKPNPERRQSC